MTTILIKKKDTAGAPAPGDLTNAAGGTEIAVNTATKRIYTKDSGGNVVELGTNSTSSTIDQLTVTTSTTLSYGTADQVQYLNASKLLVGSANLTFNGTTLTANTIGAFTLSGTIAGGGNQINNVIIGTTTPLAGAFTTLTASSTLGVTGNASVVGAAVIGGNRTPSASFPLQVISPYAATDTTERDITFFGSNEATQPFGLAVLVTGNATAANRQINIQTRTTGVANSGVLYLQNSGGSVIIQGLTVGRGAGAVASNTAVGASALAANVSGTNSVAVGASALAGQTTGGFNTAVGQNSMSAIVTGSSNTTVGVNSMAGNTSGANNAALGGAALFTNTSGANNTAIGAGSLQNNLSASNNTAVGYQAGYTNTTGAFNTFVGHTAGYTSNYNGDAYNTALGERAGYSLNTGTINTFVGSGAGYYVSSGSKNTIIGRYSGNQGILDIRTGSNFIVLSDGDGNPRLISNNLGNWGIGVVPSQSFSFRNVLQVGPTMSIAGGTSYYPYQGYVGNNFYYDSSDIPKYLESSGAALIAINAHSPGNIEMYTADAGTAGNTVSFTRVFALYKDVTLALQGATVQTGTGITFPATQSASSNANTLDDYEEGSWTPVFSTVGGDYSTLTMLNSSGHYTKIGRLVTVTANVATTGVIAGGSGQTTVKGLPFAVSAGATGIIWTDPSTGAYNSPTALPTVITVGSTSIALSKSASTNNPVFTELYTAGGNSNSMQMTVTYVAST
jgi:hypothetical protein